jgi:hypothetical protein
VANAAGGGGVLGALIGLCLATVNAPPDPQWGHWPLYFAAGAGIGIGWGGLMGVLSLPVLLPLARRRMLFAYRAGHDEMRYLIRDLRKDLKSLGDWATMKLLDDILAKDAQLRLSATALWMRLARVAGSGGKWTPALDQHAAAYRRRLEQDIASLESRLASTTDEGLRRELADSARIQRSGLDTFTRVQTAIQRIEAQLHKNRTALETIMLKVAHTTHLEQQLTQRLSPDVSTSLSSLYDEINAFDDALREILEQPASSAWSTSSAPGKTTTSPATDETTPPRMNEMQSPPR